MFSDLMYWIGKEHSAVRFGGLPGLFKEASIQIVRNLQEHLQEMIQLISVIGLIFY